MNFFLNRRQLGRTIIAIIFFFNQFFIKVNIKPFRRKEKQTESMPMRYFVNGGPGNRSSTSKTVSLEVAATPEGEKPATVPASKEEEAKNLSASKQELTNVVVEPKAFSAVVEVCHKSQ
jgi:hypothetical protein